MTRTFKHPFSSIGKKIESKTRKAIYDFSMLKDTPAIAIALSGGKDSLTLLYMLKAIIGRGFRDMELYAIHIDGDFSCGASFDKNYLKNLCESLNVKFILKSLKINLKKNSCYTCARERRKLIFDIAKNLNVNTIAFGHHLDDSIQTLLLNLFHKAEFEKIEPIIKFKAYNATIIRPLIYVLEDEIIKFSKQNNLLKTFCKCPYSQNSKRKDVKNIIENIENLFPNIKTNLSKASFVYSLKKALLK